MEAIKLGATNYLTKPANTDDIEAAFARVEGDADATIAPAPPTSIKTLEWEHIHQTLADVDFNISEAARRLGMHRRTLARKLDKRHMVQGSKDYQIAIQLIVTIPMVANQEYFIQNIRGQ